MDKIELRKTILSRLSSFDGRKEESRIIVERILQLKEWKEAETILLFSPMKSEADITPLLSDPRVLLPYTSGEEMEFSKGRLIMNPLGFMEPEEKTPALYRKALMIVPLVAADRLCHRMGRGKGFYDRYISLNKDRLTTFGLALSPSMVDKVPVENHDQRLDGIITADGVYYS